MPNRNSNPHAGIKDWHDVAEPGEVFVNVSPWLLPGVKDYYKISNYGRVFNVLSKRFVQPNVAPRRNHLIIRFETSNAKSYSIERRINIRLDKCVLIHFRPIPYMFDMEVIHLDGDDNNNRLDNLMFDVEHWKKIRAQKEALQHRIDHVRKYGEYVIMPILFGSQYKKGFVRHRPLPKMKVIRPMLHITNTTPLREVNGIPLPVPTQPITFFRYIPKYIKPLVEITDDEEINNEPIKALRYVAQGSYSNNPNFTGHSAGFIISNSYVQPYVSEPNGQITLSEIHYICRWFAEHNISREASQIQRIPYFIDMLEKVNYFGRPINGMLEMCNNIFDRKIYTSISCNYIF